MPITAAAPKAIKPIVPADMPFDVFVPASSPAMAAPSVSVAGFFGHVSQASAATAGETDPRLIVRKQAAQKIATTDFKFNRGRLPRIGILHL